MQIFYEILKNKSNIIDEFDFSNYPENHPLFNKQNKLTVLKYKDEFPADTITDFIALKPKLYSIVSLSEYFQLIIKIWEKNFFNEKIVRKKFGKNFFLKKSLSKKKLGKKIIRKKICRKFGKKKIFEKKNLSKKNWEKKLFEKKFVENLGKKIFF